MNTTKQSGFSRQGFTLVEIMIAIGIIALLAAIAVPAFAKMRRTAQDKKFIADIRTISHAFEEYATANPTYPADGTPGVVPPEMAGSMPRIDFTQVTSIGGQWDWDKGVFGYVAGISVYQPSRTDSEMEDIDAALDDGVLTTGTFRKRTDGFIYVIE
jgi:prepilin-type N-terminal cleavage/methylation domain-containing protein